MVRTIVGRVASSAVLTVALIGGAAAAHATVHRSELGANIAQSVDRLVRAYDNECDSQWVRANYNTSGGSGGLNNKSGCNTSSSLTAARVATAVQICESRTLQPMNCSGWNTEY